ncbi:MAG: ABC transporter substrate-binding protein [Peptococcaceae bacterium]|nr:ABC transporter substrate-binding protein [Peptococcaceae bacterium]MDH7524214.1 ABC transporter substrate-binding protein [Peptococcaceae bacterium]
MLQCNHRKVLPITFLLAIFIVAMGIAGCAKKEAGRQAEQPEQKPTLVFADAGWDSIRFHNDVAGFIIKNGYGYKTDVITGNTPVTFTGLRRGDIDIYMEVWTDNIIDEYTDALEKGDIIEVSVNFDDDMQGLYVPTYVIKGDPSRGIKASAPGLRTVSDLAKYWQVFRDPEDKNKGRIYGAIPGWAVDKIITEKIKNYGLDKYYNIFHPGSDTALSTSMVQAVEKGVPWVGYYWEPTWIIGKYDMTLLQEEPYSKEKWEKGYMCQFPAVKVTVAINKDLTKDAPDVVEFLKKYKTSSSITSEALAYMQEKNVGTDEAAKYFLKNHKDTWTKWVPSEIAGKIEAALNK